MATQVIKVTLSSGKVVLMRKMRISDTELAAQEVSHKANGDMNLMQIMMTRPLVRNLLIQVDGKELTAAEKESLDDLFQPGEWSQLLHVVGELSGGKEAGKLPQLEVVTSGDK